MLPEIGEKIWSPARVAAMRVSLPPFQFTGGKRTLTACFPPRRYMLHPFAIVTTLARSSIAFSNLFLALALDTALGGTSVRSGYH